MGAAEESPGGSELPEPATDLPGSTRAALSGTSTSAADRRNLAPNPPGFSAAAAEGPVAIDLVGEGSQVLLKSVEILGPAR
jgi:hypothetical protein